MLKAIQKIIVMLVAGILQIFFVILGILRILFRISTGELAELMKLRGASGPPPMDGEIILLVPIGNVSLPHLNAARDALIDTFAQSVEVTAPIEIPTEAYHKHRDQYNAVKLTEAIKVKRVRADTFRAIGIIDKDIYLPVTNFIFGMRIPGTRVAVIGLQRLHPSQRTEEGKSLMERRIKTLVVSQMSSSLVFEPCNTPRCARQPTSNLHELDQKSPQLCPTCAEAAAKWLKPTEAV